MAAMAYKISRGEAFAGRSTSPRDVLVLDKDNPPAAVRDRCRRLDIHYHPGFRIWGLWNVEEPPSPGGAIIFDWVARTEPKPLILVHSSVSFHPGDENDAAATRQYMSQYAGLTKLGATIMLEHQSGKGDSSRDYRGSSDYKAASDLCWHVSNAGALEGRLTVVTLRAFKQRLAVEKPVLQLRYNTGSFIAEDAPQLQTISERLGHLLRSHPRITKQELETLAKGIGIGQTATRHWLEQALRAAASIKPPAPITATF
jgi:hypothetical protein